MTNYHGHDTSTSDTAGTSSTWVHWCSDSTSTATASTDAWGGWVQGTTASATVDTSPWGIWSENANNVVYNFEHKPIELTEEQIAEREARKAELEANRIAKAEAKQLAEQKAEELLVGILTEEQQKDLEENNAFNVTSEFEKLYRISRGRVRNIHEIDENGNRISNICAHPRDRVPDADTMAAQALSLMYNEKEFIEIANIRQARQ